MTIEILFLGTYVYTDSVGSCCHNHVLNMGDSGDLWNIMLNIKFFCVHVC